MGEGSCLVCSCEQLRVMVYVGRIHNLKHLKAPLRGSGSKEGVAGAGTGRTLLHSHERAQYLKAKASIECECE